MIVMHEHYSRPNNDVALVKMEEAIPLGDFIKPICFPTTDKFDYSLWKGCYVTGWGLQEEYGKVAPVLQQAALTLIPSDVCRKREVYGDSITENMICAGYISGGIDACQGDSGGPLSCHPESTDNYFLIGIVSWGEGCGQAFKPGVYTLTSKYVDWVQRHVTLAGESQVTNLETPVKNEPVYVPACDEAVTFRNLNTCFEYLIFVFSCICIILQGYLV
ncbi:transmembrane protease serine 3-like [Protopterus annectens]|uniref:transmembrane protease serine 3-like n=1 Tax=Protopterus annectens TaxID=7888 RepID=UPI001CFA8544|nr:transmembrane protease serine 3-like [Protopterus annectens]